MLDLARLKELELRYETYKSALEQQKPQEILYKSAQSHPKDNHKQQNSYLHISDKSKYLIVGVLFVLLGAFGVKFWLKNEPKNTNANISHQATTTDKSELAKQNFAISQVKNEIAQQVIKELEQKNIQHQTTKDDKSSEATQPASFKTNTIGVVPAQNDTLDQATKSNQTQQNQNKAQEHEPKQGYLKLARIENSSENTIDEAEILIPYQAVQSEQNLPKKARINIKTAPIKDDLNTQKEHLNQTQDPAYATNIAKKFLSEKDYENALKYALIANELDKENEDSWVIFATAKYHLGQKQDALRALKAYNEDKNRKNLNLLIRKIQADEL